MSDAVVTLALRTLRSNFRGELRLDERQHAVKYVIDPTTGRLVIPIDLHMLEASDTVLFIPEERDGAMELMLTLEPIAQHSSDEALADRWRIYHGDPVEHHFAFCTIDAARHDGFVIDGEALMQPNPLASDEPKLCKLLNELGSELLATITRSRAGRQLEAPVAVGVDPFGVDIRARFEIVRLAPEAGTFENSEATREALTQWIREARRA